MKAKAAIEKNPGRKQIRQYLCVGVFAVLLAVLLCTVEKAEIYGSSMEPTLMEGDDILVEKLSYQIRSPQRFDIVIFRYRDGKSDEGYRLYAKRIIGLPGETIQIIAGEVYLNGERLSEPQVSEPVLKPGRAAFPVILGEDEYFLLGDNRNASADSRSSDIGNVHKSSILGRVMFRIGSTEGKAKDEKEKLR
ncbi:MAG: signal peptidase I [Lachnospiraceae bacterium]|nr:signal peptidase I [Lachnospiraceae bacterium]